MSGTATHAALMDRTYRHQRLFYDLTRRYFLLGRLHLVRHLSPPEGGRVLEIACGTGWNLGRIRGAFPGRHLYGIDISAEMLRTARAKLGGGVVLAQGDARDFDAPALLGHGAFDRVVLSYSVSMIPDWHRAVDAALDCLAPGGQLHIVDFGDQSGLPVWFRALLRGWLRRFHVTPRADFAQTLSAAAARHGGTLRFEPLYRGYAWYGVVSRP